MNFKDSVKGLVDPKIVAVLQFFILNPNKDFCLNEVSEASKVPLATTHRILKKLIKQDLIKFNKIKSLRVYSLNSTDAVNYLMPLFEDSDAHISEFVDIVYKDPFVHSILRYGKESKDRVNILIIGRNVNAEAIKVAVYEIKEKYGITLNTLVLEPEQYQQMLDMGLYSGKKVLLYSK